MLGILLTLSLVAACGPRDSELPASARHAPNIERGRALAATSGCGACHTIGGVSAADGTFGPALSNWNQHAWIAGVLPNTPSALQHWISHPQSVKPGVAMPELSLADSDAADIAAFLFTRQ